MSDTSSLLSRLCRQNLLFMSELRTHLAILKNQLSVGKSHGDLTSDSNDLIKQYTTWIEKIGKFIEESTPSLDSPDSINTALSEFDDARKKLCTLHMDLVQPKGGKSKYPSKNRSLKKKRSRLI